MPIFDQGYQHWDGKVSPFAARWLVITHRGVTAQWKGWMVRIVVASALAPALALVAFLVVWGLFEQKSTLIAPLIALISNMPEELRQGAKGYRWVFWTMAFHVFFNIELFFSMILVLLVGPNLISQDLRFNAIPLYFSRPIRRSDYFLGKLGVIGVYIAAVSIAPALFAYVLGVGFSLDRTVLGDTLPILVAALVQGVVIVVSAGTLMLAISSLSKNSRMVGALWVGLWLVSGVVSGSLSASVRADWCPAVSYQTNLLRISEALLDKPAAQAKLDELTRAGSEGVRAVIRPPIGLDRRGGRGRGPAPGPDAPPRAPRLTPGYDDSGNFAFPWTLSAGILGGLLLLSVVTLSSRVKSLDRLR